VTWLTSSSTDFQEDGLSFLSDHLRHLVAARDGGLSGNAQRLMLRWAGLASAETARQRGCGGPRHRIVWVARSLHPF
jgi:hypothetical protein